MPKPTSLDRDSPHADRTAPRNVVLTRHPAPQVLHVGALPANYQRGIAAGEGGALPSPFAAIGAATLYGPDAGEPYDRE